MLEAIGGWVVASRGRRFANAELCPSLRAQKPNSYQPHHHLFGVEVSFRTCEGS